MTPEIALVALALTYVGEFLTRVFRIAGWAP